MAEVKIKKTKVAWGITGAGDKIAEIIETMKELKQQSEGTVEIDVYLSKAADIMLKFYRLDDELKKSFAKVTVESNSNLPFQKSQWNPTQTRRSSLAWCRATNTNSS